MEELIRLPLYNTMNGLFFSFIQKKSSFIFSLHQPKNQSMNFTHMVIILHHILCLANILPDLKGPPNSKEKNRPFFMLEGNTYDNTLRRSTNACHIINLIYFEKNPIFWQNIPQSSKRSFIFLHKLIIIIISIKVFCW
jgi:hypothetical protein